MWKMTKAQPTEERAEKIEAIKKEVEAYPYDEEPSIPAPPVVKKKPKEMTQVVAQLPTREIRKYVREDGVIVNLITIEEALTEFFNARSE